MSQPYNNQVPMQGRNPMAIQGPQMPIYNNQQIPGQASFQQINMQGSMPMQGPGAQMQMQGPGNPMSMQGHPNQIPMQRPGNHVPASQGLGAPMHVQGPRHPMQNTGQPMPMQGPGTMYNPSQQMMIQRPGGPQMFRPSQGVPSGPPQMRGGGMDMAAQRMQQFGGPPGGQFGVAPPAYTPEMAKQFVTKQQIMQREQKKLMEKQRKKMEEEFKHRQFQETQKRLKEFSAIGGRKMDVDTAISSIIGPTDTHHQQQQAAHATRGHMQGVNQMSHMTEAAPPHEAPPQTQEDDFADFMSCPVTQTNQIAPDTEPANQVTDNKMTADPTTDENKEDKKDLVSMMFECSDLSAPKQAKSFRTRTTVKETQPNVKVASFQQSNRARQWSGDQEQLTELFTLKEAAAKDAHPPSSASSAPPPGHTSAAVTGVRGALPAGSAQPPPPAVASTPSPPRGGRASLPQWLTGEKPVPPVYTMVLEASTRDGEIDTSMLYPILLRSRLPKEMLGHLWSLCNKQTPGRLATQELFLLLAMVTVAQNGLDVSSLDILLKCVEPPVPDLGQNSQPQRGSTSTATDTHSKASSDTTTSVAMTTVPTATTQDDDFADFKSAGLPSGKPDQGESFGDFKSCPTPSVGAAPPPQGGVLSAPNPRGGGQLTDLIGEEDKYSALRVSVDEPATEHTSSVEVHTLVEGSSFAEFGAFKDSSSTSEALSFSSPSSSNQESVFSEDSSSSNQKSDDSNWGFPTNQKTDDNNWGGFTANQKPDDKDWGISANQMKSKQHIPEEDDFGDFADFRNTSNTSISSTATNETPDKMSALKALIGDRKLYSEKPKEIGKNVGDIPAVSTTLPNLPEHSDKTKTEDDWDPFVKSSGTSDQPGFFVEENSVSWGAEPIKMVGGKKGDSGEQQTTETSGGEGWADFTSAPVVKSDKFASAKTKDSSSSAESKLKFDKKKANSLFSQNIATSSIPPTGLSALDTEPPEFPESPELADQDDHHGYDKLAAFHNIDSSYDFDSPNGLSSLAAPYGGFDDAEESKKAETSVTSDPISAATANQKQINNIQTGNMKTSQSASSFEFSGWRSQSKGILEDSQSMQSLDLPVAAGSQDGSPAGIDSQSVSSLDFSVSEAKKINHADNKSVGSLDLGAEPVGVEPVGAEPNDSEEGFGEFSGTNVLPPEPVKPWTVAETPINQADRYSQLMGDTRDSDRHLQCWDKCLSACVEILRQANDTFNDIDSLSVCREVVESGRGHEYLQGVTEIFRVASRIRLAMHGLTMSSDDLEEHQKELHNLWNNLISFMANSPAMPPSQSLSFKKALIRSRDEENLSERRLCGVCLLDADVYSDSEAANQQAGHKLTYGGRHYHAPCANFWVNCVDCMLPALKIPDLL